MRRIGNIVLLLVVIALSGYGAHIYMRTPCDTVLEYSIGRFDGNFGLSQERFKEYIARSEAVWEKEVGKELFRYDPGAAFTVNLVYDERQRETIQRQRTESGLDAAEAALGAMDSRLAASRAQYDSRSSVFEQMKSSFERAAAEYESRVEHWNARGGAPQGEYEKLEAERVRLDAAVTQLNAEAEALNSMADELNNLVDERNAVARNYNVAAESYNAAYGDRAEFNQAEYDGETISIYQFDDAASLVTALAHEFGHALGLDHVDNAESVMYYLRDGGNTSSAPELSPEDQAELARVCRL